MNRQEYDSVQAIPRYLQYTSPVSLVAAESNGQTRANTLPLNLIAHIVSYLDDIGDISRVTRTSRLLYYITLPRLYQRVVLHSYPTLRYVNGRPEGYGSGSPLLMAINGLVTKSHAGLVEDFRIWGLWRELAVADFTVGRVPDNNMMLSILLRVAIDRMVKLQTFAWELDCKPLKTVYQGLALRDSLTTLTLKFSSSRQPRPTVLLPPMANLRAFRATDIDPLCYPDDISLLLLESKRLQDLRLHFSPRMRAQAEASLNIDTYFGRIKRSGDKLRIKHVGIQNWYGPLQQGWKGIFDEDTCKSTTFLDVFGGVTGDFRTAFIDETWTNARIEQETAFARCRTNETAPTFAQMIAAARGIQQLYIVSVKPRRTGSTPDMEIDQLMPLTPEEYSPNLTALGRDYLHGLTRSHGETLVHLLLSSQWVFSTDELSGLLRFCPKLEQLGIGLDKFSIEPSRLLSSMLNKLYALRLHHNEGLAEELRHKTHAERMVGMGRCTYSARVFNIRWLGFGRAIYHFGDSCSHVLEDGRVEMRREVTMASLEDVQDIEIWSMDCLDLMKDPVAPF